MKTKHGNGSKQPGDQTAVRKMLLRGMPALLLSLGGGASAADEVGAGSSSNYFNVGGYVRAWASFNLKDSLIRRTLTTRERYKCNALHCLSPQMPRQAV